MITNWKSSIEVIIERQGISLHVQTTLSRFFFTCIFNSSGTDSKFCEYGPANTETGSPNTARQLSAPLSAKKTVLRDLQNENIKLVPKSGPPLSIESRPTSEFVKTSGPKRSAAESLVTPSPHQFPMSNAGNEHLVYARRKADTELGRRTACGSQSDGADCSQLRETNLQDEATRKKSEVKEPKICISEISTTSVPSSVGFSSAIPVVMSSTEKSNNILPQENLNCLHASLNPGSPVRVDTKHWEERYIQLQNLLRELDQSDQNDYIQMLRSLPSVELSRHAVELEKRTIHLSLKEAKELQRVGILDVLERYSKPSRMSLTQQDHS